MSQLRRGRDAKTQKDRSQALVLCAVLGDLHPGALESAVESVPARARKHLRHALDLVRQPLEKEHPRAWEELNALNRTSTLKTEYCGST